MGEVSQTGAGPPGPPGPPSADGAANGQPDGQPLRLAAIDVGSNSIRLIVAEPDGEGGYRVLDDEKVTARLGQGLGRSGRLDEHVLADSADAIHRMATIARGYGAFEIRAIGTAAMRDAANAGELIEQVRRDTGLDIHIIGPEEEGRLAHHSVARAFELGEEPYIVADIGGGSTEIVHGRAGHIERIDSLRLGAVRLTERFGGPDAAAGERFEAMKAYIGGAIEARIADAPSQPDVIYGAGGTFNALAAMHLAMVGAGGAGRSKGEPSDSVQGHEMDPAAVQEILEMLRKSPNRASIAGLHADRADIIVAGVTIVERLLAVVGAHRLRVHDRGIRDGLLLEMFRELAPDATEPPSGRMGVVRRFARRCRYEQAHAEHVTCLALSIFDQLVELLAPPGFDEQARQILEAAAVLHDIGYLVNYTSHHRHSMYLIAHSGELDGWTPREVELVANVARYHRKSEPKSGHERYHALSKEDRKLVRGLAGILRIADGLDRTHTQRVRDVRVGLGAEGGEGAIEFTLAGEGDILTDVWGAERKSHLFERYFERPPVFRFEPLQVQSGADASAGLNGPATLSAGASIIATPPPEQS
jgi:exopolyphosphatase / guanosine-5'-triphosphate,3'-diphosphate pyrophosphatase